MLGVYEKILEFLKARSKDELARISAFLLTPLLVLSWSVFGFFGGEAISLERAVTISELRTEIVKGGGPAPKRGVVLIAEPESSEYRIPLGPGASKIWSSLDEEAAHANVDRLVLDGGGLKGKTPLIGVSGPVTLVIEGELGQEIQVPGGTERAEDWRLASRRANSLVATVMASCFFAFGVSVALATGASPMGGNQDVIDLSRKGVH
jgi:hypothetical protein